MGAQLRAVRQRIRSIQSTAKITRAQELIASSRIIRAQQRVRDAAPYAREITQAVEVVVSRSAQIDHPIVNLRILKNRNFAAGILLITTLCAVLYGTTAALPIRGSTDHGRLRHSAIKAGDTSFLIAPDEWASRAFQEIATSGRLVMPGDGLSSSQIAAA